MTILDEIRWEMFSEPNIGGVLFSLYTVAAGLVAMWIAAVCWRSLGLRSRTICDVLEEAAALLVQGKKGELGSCLETISIHSPEAALRDWISLADPDPSDKPALVRILQRADERFYRVAGRLSGYVTMLMGLFVLTCALSFTFLFRSLENIIGGLSAQRDFPLSLLHDALNNMFGYLYPAFAGMAGFLFLYHYFRWRIWKRVNYWKGFVYRVERAINNELQ